MQVISGKSLPEIAGQHMARSPISIAPAPV